MQRQKKKNTAFENNSIITRELIEAVNKRVPDFGACLRYDSSRNMIVNSGWTSGMGHYYFRGMRANDRLTIVFSMGLAYWGTLYLNQIDVYCNDGFRTRLIGTRRYDCCSYSNYLAVQGCTEILKGYIASQARMPGGVYGEQRIHSEANEMALSLCNSNPQRLIA